MISPTLIISAENWNSVFGKRDMTGRLSLYAGTVTNKSPAEMVTFLYMTA